jgi:hypothetical protein
LDVVDPTTNAGIQKAHAGSTGIYASGEGVVRGEVGKPATFKIHSPPDSPPLHDGNLKVVIRGPSRVDSDLRRDSADGNFAVWYVAREPGVYQIDIDFEREPIVGSPFKVCF